RLDRRVALVLASFAMRSACLAWPGGGATETPSGRGARPGPAPGGLHLIKPGQRGSSPIVRRGNLW
ncbi:MAG TPA: hypothetical protein VMW58_07835, partial [Anaerolineae bacterium]|nr:hypothetical protein [Anaerolineae bacterium]